MKSLRRSFAALGLACLAASALHATQHTALFDGKSFAGWDGDTNKTWRVADGMIVGGDGKEKVPRNEFIATAKNYANFVLRLKFKLTGSDGFVNSRRPVPQPARAERQRNDRLPGRHRRGLVRCHLRDESRPARTGAMAHPNEADVKKAVKPGEWNDYEIRAEGRRVILKINGVQMVDYTEADEKIPQSRPDRPPDPRRRTHGSPLQGHHDRRTALKTRGRWNVPGPGVR